MNIPSKCKNCKWYGKPYWSIINPCDNCPMENVETYTVWQDPTIKEKDKEIERLNNIINELEKYIEESYKYNSKCLSTIFEARVFEDNKILDKLQELKGDGSNDN